MTNVELRKYLGYVIEAERSVMILKKAVSKMNDRIQMLGQERAIEAPKKEKSADGVEGTIHGILGSIIIGALGGWIVSAFMAEKGWFIFKLFYAQFKHIAIGALVVLIPALIYIIASAFARKSRNRQRNRDL